MESRVTAPVSPQVCTALAGRHIHLHLRWVLILDAVEDLEIQRVSGIEAEGWGFDDLPGGVVLIAVVGIASLIDRVRQSEFGGENAILRGNAVGVVHDAADRGTIRTLFGRKVQERKSAEYDGQQPLRPHVQLLYFHKISASEASF